jgi:hypothetical protein
MIALEAVLQALPVADERVRWRAEKSAVGPADEGMLVPGARYIYIVRDGRDVIVSMAFHQVLLGGFDDACGPGADPHMLVADPQVRHDLLRNRDALEEGEPGRLFSGGEACVRHVAREWADSVAADMVMLRRSVNEGLARIVRYEELVADTERERGALYRWLNVSLDEVAPLNEYTRALPDTPADQRPAGAFFRRGQPGDHRRYLTDDQIRWIEEEAGETLVDLGYPLASR